MEYMTTMPTAGIDDGWLFLLEQEYQTHIDTLSSCDVMYCDFPPPSLNMGVASAWWVQLENCEFDSPV